MSLIYYPETVFLLLIYATESLIDYFNCVSYVFNLKKSVKTA